MPLTINNPEVETLAAEVAAFAGETTTEAARKALHERRSRLGIRPSRRRGAEDFLRFLATEVWPKSDPSLLGRRPSREEEDKILGYGPEGV